MQTMASQIVAVSRPAAWFIRRHGGKVYVWTEDFSPNFLRLRTSTRRHPLDDGREYRERRIRDTHVFLDPDLVTPRLAVKLVLIPRPHVSAVIEGDD